MQSLKSETIQIDDFDDDNESVKKFECDICGRNGFSNRLALAGHIGHCKKKNNIQTNKNNQNIKKNQDDLDDIYKERGFSEFDFNDLSKNEKAAFLKRQKRKRNPKEMGIIYSCLNCNHLSDHKGNMVQHQNRIHSNKKQTKAKKVEKIKKCKKERDEPKQIKYEKKRIMTRKRKREQMNDDVLNEPKKKKQKQDPLECSDCPFIAKNAAGLSAHARAKKHGKFRCGQTPMIIISDDSEFDEKSEQNDFICDECDFYSEKLLGLKVHQSKRKHGQYYKNKKKKRSDKEENDSENETDQSVSMDDDDSIEIID